MPKGWRPGDKPIWYGDPAYSAARLEHAFLLKCEGLTYAKVGERLDVSRDRARQMALNFSRKLATSMYRRRTRSYFVRNP